jgi:predicted Zn-dependent protease
LAPSLTELTNSAKALKAAGRIDEAIAAYREIVRIAPGNGAVLHNLAAALGDADRYAEAVEVIERAFATGLDAPETWLVLARSLLGLGRLSESEAALRKVLDRRPQDATAHRELAQLIWMQTGDVAKAAATLNEAIRRFPGDLNLCITRAHVYGQCGNAEAEYDEVLSVLSRSGGAPMVEVAATNSALAAGKYEAAINHARAARAGLPEDEVLRQAYCRALLAVGDAAEASRVAGALHAEFPLDQNYIALQATAWRLLGDERYRALYDYDAFVVPGELAAPHGWPSREAYLEDLVEALDRRHQYATHPFSQSVRHGSQLPSINKIDEPALKAYPEAAAGPIRKYLERAGKGGDPLRRRNKGRFEIITAWSIRLPASGFHIDHVHPQGWLSSACHLRLPETLGGDARAGWLKFGEPGIPTTPKLEAEHFIEPREGVLVIFPSYMWHGTVPFEGKTSRLTVAVDISPGAE